MYIANLKRFIRDYFTFKTLKTKYAIYMIIKYTLNKNAKMPKSLLLIKCMND